MFGKAIRTTVVKERERAWEKTVPTRPDICKKTFFCYNINGKSSADFVSELAKLQKKDGGLSTGQPSIT